MVTKPPQVRDPTMPISHRYATVRDQRVFYREAGDSQAPAVLLLHGFPTSSHMFRNLMPRLAERYRVIAPDLPGFGFSEAPSRSEFDYTFDNLADVIEGFVDGLGLQRFAIDVF